MAQTSSLVVKPRSYKSRDLLIELAWLSCRCAPVRSFLITLSFDRKLFHLVVFLRGDCRFYFPSSPSSMITLSPMSLLLSIEIDLSCDRSKFLIDVTARTTSKLLRMESLAGLRSGDLNFDYLLCERCNFLYSRSSSGLEIVFLISPESNSCYRSKLNR